MANSLPDQRARQGGPGRPVLYVLIGALALLGVYMVSLMTWSGTTSPTSPQQAASQQQNNKPASSANSARVPTDNPAYPSPATRDANTTGSTTTTR